MPNSRSNVVSLHAFNGVLDSATAALAANPGASMQDIADAAGMSRATLHRRFATREDLVAAIANRSLDELREFTARVRSSEITGRAALDLWIEQGSEMAPRIGFLFAESSLDNRADLMARFEEIAQVWIGWVEDGQRRGELRVDLPARWVIDAVQGLMLSIFRGVQMGTTARADSLRLLRVTLFDGIVERTTSTAPSQGAHS